MSEGTVAERYAQALFELGSSSGQLAALADKIRDFAEVYAADKNLLTALENPVLSEKQREGVLSEVARRVGVPDVGVKGLVIMARRRRLATIPALARRLVELADEKGGVLRAHVTTAQKMPESYYQALSAQLAGSTQKKVVLERAEDPSLIGGAITRVGDAIVDGSLRGRLQEAERRLARALSVASAS
mgnify:CR=1 FL=1